jgi:hypothetical protein
MKFITDEIGKVIQRMRPIDISYGQAMLDYLESVEPNGDLSLMPFYEFGHPQEIDKMLQEKNEDMVFKYQKYPLIALKLDIVEDVNGSIISPNGLNFVFVAFTQKEYYAKDRIERVVKPVLAPLYERFFVELANSGLFIFPGQQDKPEHKRIIRPYYGTETKNANVANIFRDPLDGIEVLNLKINFQEDNCT